MSGIKPRSHLEIWGFLFARFQVIYQVVDFTDSPAGVDNINMEENEKDIWFPAKKYGFGWGLPVRWQGWIVLLIYTMLIAAGIVFIAYSENQIRNSLN